MLALVAATLALAQDAPRAGVVVMHGKGGLPDGLVLDLATFLESRGFLVANLEMPWSSRRDYDADVDAAVGQVDAALVGLSIKGARKVFIAGHSQGGVFAFYAAGKLPVDGVVAIAPGGNVAGSVFREKVAESVMRAAALTKAGKGSERATFLDYEGARGVSPVITTAAIYLTWFDPQGAMNQLASIRRLDPNLPVLFVAPTQDTPALIRAKPEMVGSLPPNPLTKVIEPQTNHMRAPTAAREEIARWITEVAAR